MSVLTLPAEVEAVLREFRACEFATLARDGTPISWPASVRISAPIALPMYRATSSSTSLLSTVPWYQIDV